MDDDQSDRLEKMIEDIKNQEQFDKVLAEQFSDLLGADVTVQDLKEIANPHVIRGIKRYMPST